MAQLVETLQQQHQGTVVCLDRARVAPETTSLQTGLSHGEAEKDLRTETQLVLPEARGQAGQATIGEEADPAGVIYGVESLMEGTAYAEDVTEPEDESQTPFIGSLRLLMDAQPGARVHYEGKLVCGDPTPRELSFKDASGSPRKRSSQDLEDKNTNTACDLVLIDNTGPVAITLWGEVVHSWYATMGNPATPYITLTNLRIAEMPRTEWNGSSLSRMRVLHSTASTALRPGTILSRAAQPTSPYLTRFTYTIPEAPACIGQFLSIQSKLRAPFRITLRGTVDDVSDMMLTQQDTKKRTFSLVDGAGMWLRCCALGRCAQSRCLANGNEVILYYGTGRGVRGSSPPMVYLMQESVILQTACSQHTPTKRAEIEIDAA